MDAIISRKFRKEVLYLSSSCSLSVIAKLGEVSPLAGSELVSNKMQDGGLESAKFFWIRGITIHDRILYIADKNKIRKLALC